MEKIVEIDRFEETAPNTVSIMEWAEKVDAIWEEFVLLAKEEGFKIENF